MGGLTLHPEYCAEFQGRSSVFSVALDVPSCMLQANFEHFLSLYFYGLMMPCIDVSFFVVLQMLCICWACACCPRSCTNKFLTPVRMKCAQLRPPIFSAE